MPEDVSYPDWCSLREESPSEILTHGQITTYTKTMKREKFKSLLLACWILLKSTLRSFYSYLWCSPIEQLLWHRIYLLLHLHSSLPDPHPLSHLNLEHLKLGASKIQCQKLSLLCKSGWKRRKIFNLLLLLQNNGSLLLFFKICPAALIKGTLTRVTWAIRSGADMCRQHFYSCGGRTFSWEPLLHFSLETSWDIN